MIKKGQMYAEKVAARYDPHRNPVWRVITPPPPPIALSKVGKYVYMWSNIQSHRQYNYLLWDWSTYDCGCGNTTADVEGTLTVAGKYCTFATCCVDGGHSAADNVDNTNTSVGLCKWCASRSDAIFSTWHNKLWTRVVSSNVNTKYNYTV